MESIKDIILKWSLKLEKEGIFGKDMIFSEEEQEKAINNQQIRIENFYGIFGSNIKGTIYQEISLSVRKADLKGLLDYLKSKGISEEDLKELKETIKISSKPMQKDKFSREISNWIGKMTAKASEGIWKIGINAATSILITALNRYFGLM